MNEQIERLKEKNLTLWGDVNQLQSTSDRTKGLIPQKQNEIKELQLEIDNILKDGANERYKTFSLSTYLTYLAFLIPLSLYLFFYYTAIANSAFYGMNPNSLINGESLAIPILPKFDELKNALE